MNAQNDRESTSRPVRRKWNLVGFIIFFSLLVSGFYLFQAVITQLKSNALDWQSVWSDLGHEVDSEIPLDGPYGAMFRLEQIIDLGNENISAINARGVLIVLLPEGAKRVEFARDDITLCKFTIYYYMGDTLRWLNSEACPILHRQEVVHYPLFKLDEPKFVTYNLPYQITGLEIRTLKCGECNCNPPPTPPPPTH